ncbi:MAG TPA: hypothetical protein VFU99_07815 [Gaiellaceae bacterium]|nr:hypothetical protein [Gaiellaceae bacterium]
MTRTTLFTFVGVVWCVRSLQSFADPQYEDPVSASDWFAVLSFSAALFATALALPMLAQMIGGRAVFRVSLVPAVGAASAGLFNLVGDALQVGFAGLFYGAGAGLTGVGLIAFTVASAVFGRGRHRLLAAVPAATLIGWSVFESGGGVLILVAWLAAAAMALDRPARIAAQTAPGSP